MNKLFALILTCMSFGIIGMQHSTTSSSQQQDSNPLATLTTIKEYPGYSLQTSISKDGSALLGNKTDKFLKKVDPKTGDLVDSVIPNTDDIKEGRTTIVNGETWPRRGRQSIAANGSIAWQVETDDDDFHPYGQPIPTYNYRVLFAHEGVSRWETYQGETFDCCLQGSGNLGMVVTGKQARVVSFKDNKLVEECDIPLPYDPDYITRSSINDEGTLATGIYGAGWDRIFLINFLEKSCNFITRKRHSFLDVKFLKSKPNNLAFMIGNGGYIAGIEIIDVRTQQKINFININVKLNSFWAKFVLSDRDESRFVICESIGNHNTAWSVANPEVRKNIPQPKLLSLQKLHRYTDLAFKFRKNVAQKRRQPEHADEEIFMH